MESGSTTQRLVAVLALVACLGQTTGCATNRRFMLDPDTTPPTDLAASGRRKGRRIEFDAGTGRVDLVAGAVSGEVRGMRVAFPLHQYTPLRLRDARLQPDPFKVDPAALLAGPAWEAKGRAQFLALRSGEILDVRHSAAAVDAGRRTIVLDRAGQVTEVSFDDTVYLEMRQAAHVRTTLLVTSLLLVGTFAALVVACGSFNMGMGDLGMGGSFY